METAKIVALAVGGAVLYGVVHDQVTARIPIEYSTVGHPRIVDTESPTLLGPVWGVVATWWVGAILGVLWAHSASYLVGGVGGMWVAVRTWRSRARQRPS